jgi:hypothetical protein
MKDPLKRITHQKRVPYRDYIEIVALNPISALVKMMDLQDNLQVLDLTKLDRHSRVRASRYLRYLYLLNDLHHFVENIQAYREKFKENEAKEKAFA